MTSEYQMLEEVSFISIPFGGLRAPWEPDFGLHIRERQSHRVLSITKSLLLLSYLTMCFALFPLQNALAVRKAQFTQLFKDVIFHIKSMWLSIYSKASRYFGHILLEAGRLLRHLVCRD